MAEQTVCVIGAGPCGLVACKTLADHGIAYECLEASDVIGGVWNVERGGGSYRSLRTNTSTRGMAFADFPFGDDYPTYPDAEQMVRYFGEYADHFGLREHVRLEQRVTDARPLDGGGWQVTTEVARQRVYSALVVATGQYTAPRRPHDSIPGEFSGQQLHAFDYLDPATPVDCRGKRVLVVGLGSSAAELAAELADPDSSVGHASQVLLSARSGRWVLPKIVDGTPIDANAPHPADPLPKAMRLAPGSSGLWLVRRMLKKVFESYVAKTGTPESLGLPKPAIEPWEERPTMSMEFIPALREGRIDVRPGIERFDDRRVTFSDGTSSEIDVILYGTGYQLDFPYIDRAVLGCDAPDLALYQRVAHGEHDGLFFVGCLRVLCSMWPLAEQQSHWIASQLNGKFELPGAAERTRKAIPLARALPVICGFYVDELRREAGGF